MLGGEGLPSFSVPVPLCQNVLKWASLQPQQIFREPPRETHRSGPGPAHLIVTDLFTAAPLSTAVLEGPSALGFVS